ncbi:hypothetical protein [Lentilactobacillus sp. Marseille-Q4993]|uniref:hypothetical protein n=1 Tax=Lentilactobacillus sp. Marseille-Q4993 TaxID=3039492 RepID=UPI0024BC1EA4|nr:hypothetical protein [Lentilactobacillus sp. Marseille-Q4993]
MYSTDESDDLKRKLIEEVNNYVGQTESSLVEYFGIRPNYLGQYPKNIKRMLVDRMLNLDLDKNIRKKIKALGLKIRTIRVNKNTGIKESVSFPAFSFTELVTEEWSECKLREELENLSLLFIVYRETVNGDYLLCGAKYWEMPAADLEGPVRAVWEQTKGALLSGINLEYDDVRNRVSNNFVKASEKRVVHIRPHASKSSYMAYNPYADKLPVPAKWVNKPMNFSDQWMTKQSFWLNKSYIFQQIESLL